MVTWTRPSGTTIDLRDTPEMTAFAEKNGYQKKQKRKAKESKPAIEKPADA